MASEAVGFNFKISRGFHRRYWISVKLAVRFILGIKKVNFKVAHYPAVTGIELSASGTMETTAS
jgi:hypothetical protein